MAVFRAMLANAEMALAKADLTVAHRYVELVGDAAVRDRIWGHIVAEFRASAEAITTIRGEDALLGQEPVLQRSVERRNP